MSDSQARQVLAGITSEAEWLHRRAPKGAMRAWMVLDQQVVVYMLWRMQARVPAMSLAYACGHARGEPDAGTLITRREAHISLRGTKDGRVGMPEGFPAWVRHDFGWTLMLRWTVLMHEVGHVLLARMRQPLRLPGAAGAAARRARLNEHLFGEHGGPSGWAGNLYHEIFADLLSAGCLLDTARLLDGRPFGRHSARRFLGLLERQRREAQAARQWDADCTAELSLRWAHESGEALAAWRQHGVRIHMPALRREAAAVASRAWLRRMQTPVLRLGGRRGPCARLRDLHAEMALLWRPSRLEWARSPLHVLATTEVALVPERLRRGRGRAAQG